MSDRKTNRLTRVFFFNLIAGTTLTFLVLGFVSRTVPQLNILTVGFPLKLAVGLVVMALTMMSLEPVLLEGLSLCMDGIRIGLGLGSIS